MNERRSPLLERPVMREQFRKELRGRLMSEAVVVLAPRTSWFFFPAVLRPVLATAVILLVVFAGTTSAAASSIPGDPLYAVKRAGEDVRLALTFDDLARTRLLAELTDRRLEELAEIAKRRPSSAPNATQEYADAVNNFANALDKLRGADSGDKRDAAEALAEAAREKHKAALDAVKDALPSEHQTEVQRVNDQEQERTSPSDERDGQQSDRRPTSTPPGKTPRR
jgi:hypothetical protein